MTCQVIVDLKGDVFCGHPVADGLALDGRDSSAVVLVCETHARMWEEQHPNLVVYAPLQP